MAGYWHIHWHRLAFRAGMNDYVACRCGHREIRGIGRYGRSPKDVRWIATGERTPEPMTPPPGRAGTSQPLRMVDVVDAISGDVVGQARTR